MHVAGAPQFYVSCAQITVTGGGSGNPELVSIPGYIAADGKQVTSPYISVEKLTNSTVIITDPSITLNVSNIYRLEVFLLIALSPDL